MPRTKRNTDPSYCLHKASGRAYVKLNGKSHPLGPHGSAESYERYRRLIAEWKANGRVPLAPKDDVRVVDLIDRFWTWSKTYYRNPDGSATSQLSRVKPVMRVLRSHYGSLPIQDFGPPQFKVVRQTFVEKGLCRTTINGYCGIIKQSFKYGVEEGLVPPHVSGALYTIRGLQIGRSDARENLPVSCVSEEQIEGVLGHVSPQVADMIRLQLVTGARPGEITKLRPIDIRMSGELWEARLCEHKTAHHGKERVLFFGPKAQVILKPYLADRALHAPLFSPREAVSAISARASTHRRPDQGPSPRKTQRRLGEKYRRNTYAQAIKRACEKADVLHWSPNQLRHNYATITRAQFGAEATQVSLGHSKLSTTEIYAERNMRLAHEVALEMG